MITWLRTHRRAALELVAVLAALAAGWALRRPAPRVELHDHQVAQVHHQERQTAQVDTAAHQVEQATATQHMEQHRRVHTHQVVHILPSGEKTETTDTTEEVGLTLETARTVNLTLQLETATRIAVDAQISASAARDTSLVQTPAAPPTLRLWGELGAQVGLPPEPYAGLGAGLRLAKVPLVPARLWLVGEGRFRPAQSPEVRVGLRLEIGL